MEMQTYLDRNYLLEKLKQAKQAKQSHTIGIYREKITKIKQLDELFLDNNRLEEIHPKFFDSLENLKFLSLMKNNLLILNPSCFEI